MDENKITTNICKVGEYDDSVFFKAICSCISHDTTLFLEFDKEIGDIQLTTYSEITLSKWYSWSWWQVPFKRLKIALRVLFGDMIEMEGDFIFAGEQAVKDYISALQQGLVKVKIAKDIWEKENKAIKAKKETSVKK
jgi:hypothetical protein